ncbi:hypothetical protein BISA_1778 [Bifidobacterium saguini DSM 23967]|uniref:Uncharacterized protein n=2 Tax=Bifidobacterium saguini TaxID=762210 RepID=A0A087D6N1_9BIFI|nr:hypothetical protein BISA_1778 [Bifidobacterium saguini DSM 23967]
MCGKAMNTEIHTEVRGNDRFASLVAFYEPDDERLVSTRHVDGHVTIRIGKGGTGPRRELSPEAAKALAAMLVAPAKEVA